MKKQHVIITIIILAAFFFAWSRSYLFLMLPRELNFHAYDIYGKMAESKALGEINSKFPPGTSADKFVKSMKDSGARCRYVEDLANSPLYYCELTYSEPGIRFWFVTVKWRVVAYLDADKSITGTALTRNLTGP